MSEYVDDMARQGIAAGMVFGFAFPPPWGPDHRCPGCQPCPDEPAKATYWKRWHEVETKWRARGEASACPVVRGEVVPSSYTDEERATIGMPRATMPCATPRASSEVEAPSTAALTVEPISTVAPVEPEKTAPLRRTQAPRKPRVKVTADGQGSLF